MKKTCGLLLALSAILFTPLATACGGDKAKEVTTEAVGHETPVEEANVKQDAKE